MSNTVTFKRGTTYSGTVTYTPAAGGPANLLTTTVTSDIIDAAGVVYPCTITMAINGMKLWELVNLALPLIVILIGQIILGHARLVRV